MSYDVAIRNNLTKEICIRHEDLDWDDTNGNSLFWWTDGNFGCDCNREDEWLRAGNIKEEDFPEETICGQSRFSVLYVELPDKRRIVIDSQERI